MKKIVCSLAMFIACVVAMPTHAQEAGRLAAPVNTAAPENNVAAAAAAGAPAVQKPVDKDAEEAGGIAAEEAEGKALWDKLQNKQVQCQDLKEGDFDVIGDFFMGSMIGAENHERMNELMSERLGEDGEMQMHVVMGKRLSGCDPNAAYPAGSEYFTPMMGIHMGMMGGGSIGTPRAPAVPAPDALAANQMMHAGEYAYGERRDRHDSIPFMAFGIILGLAALSFFTLGSIYFGREIAKQQV